MKLRNLLLLFMIVSITAMFGCSSETKTLKISTKIVEFGEQNIDEYLDKQVILTNKYGIEIAVTDLKLSGSPEFSIVDGGVVPVNMGVGATHTITIRYTAATAGLVVGLLSIDCSETDNTKTVELTGTGIPVPRISVSDSAHDYNIVRNGTTKDFDLIVNNFGSKELTLNSLIFVGANAGLFTVSNGGATPIVINPKTSHTITVQFAPIADGNFTAELQIEHDAINENSPVIVTFDGEGRTMNPEITLNIPITSVWDMGEVNVNDTKTMDFEISNTGTSKLTVNGIVFQTATDFSFVEIKDSNGNVLNFPVSVAVGALVNAYVAFSPTAKGISTDKMEITHDGINESQPIEIDIEGEGKGVARFDSAGTFNWTVPAGITSVEVLVVGAGGGGSGSHYGGGGSGWVVVQTVSVSPGSSISITVGDGGAGGVTGTNSSPGGHGQDSSFGSYVTAPGGKGGGGGGAGYYTGGDGGSGGGGAGNAGYAGKGGSAGSNGDPGNTYAGGIGGHFDSVTGFNGNLTAGAGGAAGTSTNAGGGGAGGVLINGGGQNGGDGGETWSGKGGKGYGSGGGSGGYNSGTRPGGGKGACGLVYLEY